tara:strand:- start:2039 stop:2326 length:288 start_codon:yes stop_codon:yes gene_type:complete
MVYLMPQPNKIFIISFFIVSVVFFGAAIMLHIATSELKNNIDKVGASLDRLSAGQAEISKEIDKTLKLLDETEELLEDLDKFKFVIPETPADRRI